MSSYGHIGNHREFLTDDPLMHSGPQAKGVPSVNQTPEQAAQDKIDEQLSNAGWIVQDNKKIDFSTGLGIAVREYQTDVGPADYVLFVDKKPVGVVEARREDWHHKITTVEEQFTAPLPTSSG